MEIETSALPVKGYEGHYSVDLLGNVYSFKKNLKRKLKPSINRYGYFVVDLMLNGQGKHKSIHRIVAETFLPNIMTLPVVNHKDGNKQNNMLLNLERCSVSYNSQHAYDNYLRVAPYSTLGKKGKDAKNSRIINQFDIAGNFIASFYGALEAMRKTGVNNSKIHLVCKGERKSAGGYIWRYAC